MHRLVVAGITYGPSVERTNDQAGSFLFSVLPPVVLWALLVVLQELPSAQLLCHRL
jgi:hypothetical protein